MKILALQLKRIGDLVLTTPALRALRARFPGAEIVLGLDAGCVGLAPAIAEADSFIVFGKGRGFTPWQQVFTGRFDECFDFTGTDRSALAAAISRAPRRTAFQWARRKRLRAAAWNRFIDSPVRAHHTADHYLHLVTGADADSECGDGRPMLRIPAAAEAEAARLLALAGVPERFAVVHPFTARADKNWLPERWAEVIRDLRSRGFAVVLTGGSGADELAHHAAILAAGAAGEAIELAGKTDLLALAGIAARAALVVSCDTGLVHLAAAFERPQVALYGPINPFHWRPRHARAAIVSAAHPEAPLTRFEPRMKGAPMERISTGVVIDAIGAALARPA